MSRYAPPTRITLITHAATRAQKAGEFPLDEGLDEWLLVQVAKIKWRPIASSRMIVSPEQRTRQTAEALGLTATAEPHLRECDFGRWQGRSLEGLHAGEAAALAQWLSDVTAAPHDGESYRDLIARVAGWLDNQQGTGPAAVVTHASVVRAAVVVALGAPDEAFLRLEIAPLTLTDLRFSGGLWRVASVGGALAAGGSSA